MANYNPHIPQDLGMEWVPIRNEDLVLDPFANSLERGYGFKLASPAQVNNVRFYINEFPPLFVRNQAYTANIYPRGQEAESGPIGRVVIPCNNGTITGSGAVTSPSTATVPEVVYNPSGNYFINWQIGNVNANRASFFFATDSYANLLSGKRILGVNLLSGINVVTGSLLNPDDWAVTAGDLTPMITNDATNAVTALEGFTNYRPLVTMFTPTGTRLLVRTRLGDADMAYGTTGSYLTGTPNISQWTYNELRRFEAGAGANRLFVMLNSNTTGTENAAQVLILYMALEVFYCEERRVAFGTRNINGLRFVQARDPFQFGMNQIIVRDINGAANPVLSPGLYTVTLSEANTGDDFNVAFSPFETAKVNMLRQLYEIPGLPGVQVNLPFPLNEDAVDTTFTKESTVLLPQLSMHASGGGVLTESHAYGRQTVGQVYGNLYVSQQIDDSALTALTEFPGVRYYARRFGDTTVPLRLSSTSPTASGAGMFVQITPAEFDALEGITDGWKDVTLRFATPPRMGLAQYPTWTWTALGELSGNRWEVLGASAYAASGIAQQMPPNIQFGQVPFGQQLGPATYGGGASSVPGTPVFVAAGGGAGDNNVPISVGMPTGVQVGDLLIAFGATRGSGTTTWNNGFERMAITGAAATDNVQFWGKIADGTEGSNATMTPVGGVAGDTVTGQIVAFRNIPEGVSISQIVGQSVSITNASAQNIIIPSLTTTQASIVIAAGWKQTSWTSVATLVTPAGWVEMGDLSSTDGNDQGIVWDYLTAPTPAVINPTPFVVTGGANAISKGFQFTLQFPLGAGSQINETWSPQLGPYVSTSAPAPDASADATIIFAQDMPQVTGFTVITASQAITGIGLDCGIPPCGIPTHILYNQLSWSLPNGSTAVAADFFNRTVTDGIGSPNVGGAYTINGLASVYDVLGNRLTISPAAASGDNSALLSVGPNFDITSTVGLETAYVGGADVSAGVMGRFTDSSNRYLAYMGLSSASAITLNLAKSVGGVFSSVVTMTANAPFITKGAGSSVRMRFMGKGTLLKIKIWDPNGDEPLAWNIEVTDTSLTTGNFAGVFFNPGSAAANSGFFKDLIIGPPRFWFGYYELQRLDGITDWATIMRATDPGVSSFKDFEARTDMSSSYRIRAVDAYDFAGPWSSTVSISLLSPGVSGSCLSQAHVMIFTTNERQTGFSNLAYSNSWESEVVEDFSFAEAGFTQLQPMYDRDFFVAFRPRERGGEQFSRTVLVQAAAIAPETLADFTSLRNMAWEDVSYICVRDEEGNRWFANINVPSGVVRNRRRLYQADIQIVEVTDTPAEVDPSWY